MLINKFYYNIKPFIPRRLQIFLRCQLVQYKRKKYDHIWPIDPIAGTPPRGWRGWPDKKKFALVLTHDVDTQKGHNRCYNIMELEEKLGFCSSFNFVPERYNVLKNLRNDLVGRGFEVGVHGLKHDGKLFSSKNVFQKRVIKINQYLKDYNAVGFRSPAMHHNLDWLHKLNIEYDASTFDTDPFEPQPDGVGTIFPLWVQNSHGIASSQENPKSGSEASRRSQNMYGEARSTSELQQINHAKTLRPLESFQFCSGSKKENILSTDIQKVFRGLKCEPDEEIEQKGTFSEDRRGYVELPYTLPQDFTLFILMKEKNIDILKKKLNWIADKGGMALFNAHPDYMNFNKKKIGSEEYRAELYIEFLEYIKNRYKGQYWHLLPKDMASFWKQNFS